MNYVHLKPISRRLKMIALITSLDSNEVIENMNACGFNGNMQFTINFHMGYFVHIIKYRCEYKCMEFVTWMNIIDKHINNNTFYSCCAAIQNRVKSHIKDAIGKSISHTHCRKTGEI